ncbi:DUF3329 domain-containing protein [Peptostreptococcus faecalis]|uniref:DUF3329 domain-containing protein n=1 Tax=Peptostreptococcus faecalis TaxID=2045015 RepID=UPI000C7C62F7|nr:DUF6056 family protein [Peptostreptococcus faecalis]
MNIKKIKFNYPFIFVMSIIFMCMLILNGYTPYVADDFSYLVGINLEEISNLIDIIYNQWIHYFSVNGRSVSHTIGQILLLLDKDLVNILNSFAFCIFIYCIYSYTRFDDKYNISGQIVPKKGLLGSDINGSILSMLIFLLLWFFTPVFGQNFLWVIGSANYMWTSIIVMAVLLNFRKISIFGVNPNRRVYIIILLVFSFFSGWTNENSVPAMIFVATYYIINMYKKKAEGFIVALAMYTGVILGFLVMLSAPGNFIRLQMYSGKFQGIEKYIERIFVVDDNFYSSIIVLFLIALMILLVTRLLYFDKDWESEIYFAAGIIAYLVMMVSPIFPQRAMISTIYLFIISIVINLSYIYRYNVKFEIVISILGIIILGYQFISTYPEAILANKEYLSTYNAREILILDNKMSSNLENIKIPELPAKNKYMAAYGLEDAKDNSDDWINKSMSRYYGVESISLR